MKDLLDIATSTLASSCRFWNGTVASKNVAQPEKMLILFDQEGCSECRLVREVLTELNLNVIVAPCPIGGQNLSKFKSAFNDVNPPMLVDLNSQSAIKGAEEIVCHLFQQYKGIEAPKGFVCRLKNSLTSKLATGVRLGAGLKAKRSQQPEQPLILYSFESSPFSRPVRECLCELELTYILINLGKQQLSDMGAANFRWTIKTYTPLPNTKRDDFFKLHGKVQVPYLLDPNTGAELFESKDILRYLQQTYAL
ncbi:glutathione S-transferase N-terminal domain-containing protein [uncultured Photobacterium sp.]|uniref:glutathione S-transferase N-terminal domain-containing protein n=1 Tax=uncultured Photobacterium sp. TaxID=173973 RepID=UPI0026194F5C|nr:glutathione S-transferase N-terminal domain-containing protein [uncultured Photobacterium sp.]